jgi:hypothetical protein
MASATAAADWRRARPRALRAMASSSSRCRPCRRCASDAADISACGRCTAAPCSAMYSALSRWCAVVDTTKGISTLGTPAAHSSLTVMAPARQMMTSQSARRCAMLLMKGSTSASTAAGLRPACHVAGLDRVQVGHARLVRDAQRTLLGRDQGQGLGHNLVERARTQAATDDQHAQRAGATGKALGRRRDGLDLGTHGVAGDAGHLVTLAAGPSKPQASTLVSGSIGLVAQQQGRIGVDHHQRQATGPWPSGHRGSRHSRPCPARRWPGGPSGCGRTRQSP